MGASRFEVIDARKPSKPRIPLSAEQNYVLNLVRGGQNVFFTGPAGTGKSRILEEIIEYFEDKYDEDFKTKVAITASTGIAALNIDGSTLHSWATIGLGKEDKEKLCKKVKKGRWKATDVLIIDEISMIDGKLFDKLEWIGRKVRESDLPFGGIQLVITGDFFQLPPVQDMMHDLVIPATFAFEAESWEWCTGRPVFLTQVFRQVDPTFVNILNNLRLGRIIEKDLEPLRELRRQLVYADGIEATELFPTRREVDICNKMRLEALTGEAIHYTAMDFAGSDRLKGPIADVAAEKLLKRFTAPQCLSLKVGAIVMLVQNINIEKGLVNGSRGIITEFLTISSARERELTIAELPGQSARDGYTLEPTRLLRPLKFDVFEKSLLWPLVLFENHETLVCPAVDFKSTGPIGNVEAMRTQVPLILAWAISIHKSQGQTLERVRVSVGHAFEKGQVYVALSRAKSMEGLQIDAFEPTKVLAHPTVLEWHRRWQNDHRNGTSAP